MPANGDEETFVRISNRQIFDKLTDMEHTVLSMDGRMNAILAENVGLRERVRALELKVYTVLASIGGAALIGGGMLVKALVGGGSG